jgi:hypothetical protein
MIRWMSRAKRVDPVPVLRVAVETLREQLAKVEAREAARADKAEADLRDSRAAAMLAELASATATEALQQLEQAERHRKKGQGRWARILAAWKAP